MLELSKISVFFQTFFKHKYHKAKLISIRHRRNSLMLIIIHKINEKTKEKERISIRLILLMDRF